MVLGQKLLDVWLLVLLASHPHLPLEWVLLSMKHSMHSGLSTHRQGQTGHTKFFLQQKKYSPHRDTYIWVDFNKITAGGQAQYKKCSACLTHGTPYDCMSVMHYRDWGFAQGGPTMLPRSSTCDLKTATNKLTRADIDLLNAMYSCSTGPLPNSVPVGQFSASSIKN